MDPPTLPFTEAELNKAGLLGDGVSELAAQAVKTMKEHPELLKLSLFTLECINLQGHQRKGPSSPRSPGSPTLSDVSAMSSNLFALTSAVSEYSPDEYERISYYNGITGDGDHPELVYRSNFHTTLFPKPVGRHAHIPIRDLIKARKIPWSSVDPARFFTHGPPGEEAKGSLGPVVIWVGVIPGSTSSDTAHEVSQEILALLLKNGVEGAVVEWREAVPQRLAGVPLMRHVGSSNATHYVRRFLTPLLGVPLATEEMEEEDAQGTLTLWFHENKDKDGNPSNKVYGVSNCHVLRKNTTRGLDEITKAISDHGILADLWAREIVELQAKERQDVENAREIRANRRKLDDENEAIADLEAFYDEVTKYWSNIKLHRNIGHAKVKDEFEGNVVDLGSKYSPQKLTEMFYPLGGGPTTFRFPEGRKLRIEGCATKEDLSNPAEFDSEGQRCLIVGKDGNTTDLTVGLYAGLVSFTLNEVGIESVELGIYNSGNKTAEVFSAKGDSGSLVWHMTNGKARIVGQLHSGHNKGGSTSNHVTYCTPGWYFLDQIKKRFKYADF
ncbi:hypothetical protein F5887DRAFT_1024776 [Amanita rubescens]|nr:hypothetical protein F5887DRAFT_1024776 [Amanita rubescens]